MHGHDQTAVSGIGGFQCAVVKVNGTFGYCKAKPGSARLSLTGIRYSKKRMENIEDICIRNAGAVISHGDFSMRLSIDHNFF